jgi:type II secretory pathway pseudopilin PulG
MSAHSESAFTLIEVVLVTAISSLLLIVALLGQAALHKQALFDAGVNRIESAIADAKSQSTAGINLQGNGDGSQRCPGGGSDPFVFAGTMLSVDSTAPLSPVRITYYEAQEPKPGTLGTVACEISSMAQSVEAGVPDLSVSLVKPAAPKGALLLIRTLTGGLAVCYATDLSAGNIYPAFAAGGCTGGVPAVSSLPAAPAPANALDILLQDSEGRSSHIIIDQSGLPRRAG